MTIISWAPSSEPPGAEEVIPVPSGKTWRVIGMTCTLATANAGSARTANWVLHDADDVAVVRIPLAITIPVNVTLDLTAWIGANSVYVPSSGTVIWASIPDITLPAGWSWHTYTKNLNANDHYTNLEVVLDEETAS
jgi:hypothetical protein